VSADYADDPTFELAWPRESFVSEASELLAGYYLDSSIELLLTEAFRSERLAQRYGHKPSRQRPLLEKLLPNADALREAFADPPYWPRRHNASGQRLEATATRARKDFKGLIVDLRQKGYFDEKFPQDCQSLGHGIKAVDVRHRLEPHGVPASLDRDWRRLGRARQETAEMGASKRMAVSPSARQAIAPTSAREPGRR
jgi:hypothetical protein